LIYKVESNNSGHRLLPPFQIPNHVAIKIALELKKLLVDNSLLDVYVHPSLHPLMMSYRKCMSVHVTLSPYSSVLFIALFLPPMFYVS
jgi:hypothetical protein